VALIRPKTSAVFRSSVKKTAMRVRDGAVMVNYGMIGTVVAHELIHGFDDEGRKYDGAGALSNWWTKAQMPVNFNARAAELGRQFDAYQPYPGVHVRGDLTMGENIADLGGALVALDAYHLSLGDTRAPSIDGLSGDQRFFLS
jgi:putative endopeptidase